MDPRLQAVERGVAAAGSDQLVMAAVLDEPAVLDGQDVVAPPHGRQPVGSDDDGAAAAMHSMFCRMMRSLS